ncbi:MAG: PilZ domain-containing protein [Chrysiogenales bacterium]|nr:MAG: PilZ domain-containing protein [Chrysiogenales bacterium]
MNSGWPTRMIRSSSGSSEMLHRHAERRLHTRMEISCPLAVADSAGRELFQIRTTNISNGGLYIETPVSNLPQEGVPDEVHLRISVPRTTSNTFKLDEFRTAARLVRSDILADDDSAGIALQFVEPLALGVSA